MAVAEAERLVERSKAQTRLTTEPTTRRGPWRGLDDLELATLEWVDWYNRRRLHSALDYLPPAEYERNQERELVSAGAGTQ